MRGKHRQHLTIKRWGILVLWLAITLGACTDLAGEPEIVMTVPPPTERPADLGYPATNPDLGNGARLFALHCTSCHGINGDGQGELVLAGSVPAMPSFLDADHVRTQTPATYFDMITRGNLTNLMPPWEFVLTEQERWDVTLYVHTLHITPDQLERGATLYAQACADCHGETGRGDGVEMLTRGYDAFDYHEWLTMRALSDEVMATTVREGIGDSMPAFAPDWDDEAIYAVVAYARSLALIASDAPSQADDPVPLATEEASTHDPVSDTVAFFGRVTNGTRGGQMPTSGDVFLRYGNLDEGIRMMEGQWDADGLYRFDGVPRRDDFDYIVIAQYDEINFPGTFVTGDEIQTEAIEQPITIYERTEDPFSISINAIETRVDTFTVEDIGTGLLLRQRVTYTNASDRVYRTDRQAGAGRYATLLWQLPPGAIILNDPNSPRYLLAREQYALIDTAPVLPGADHQLEAIFFLPYEDGAIIDQPLTQPLEGRVIVDVLPERLEIISQTLTARGANPDGSRRYQADLTQATNQSLIFEIQGAITPPLTSQTPNIITAEGVTILVIVFGGVVLAFIVYLVVRQQPQKQDDQMNELIRQIAELDAMHQEGRINHDAYQRQRQELKARLTALMQSARPPT